MRLHLNSCLASTSVALLVTGALAASTSAARAQTASCIEERPVDKAVVELRRDEGLVQVEHTCAGWQTPVHIDGVRVLATDLAEDAGQAVALLRVEPAGQPAFERRVAVGDRVGERWVVVAATEGVVLFDDQGTLLAALDQRPVTSWRLTWHSPFSMIGVPAAAPSAASPPPKPGARAKPADASKVARPASKVRKK